MKKFLKSAYLTLQGSKPSLLANLAVVVAVVLLVVA